MINFWMDLSVCNLKSFEGTYHIILSIDTRVNFVEYICYGDVEVSSDLLNKGFII